MYGQIEYNRLKVLLQTGKWKEADLETLALMLQIAGKENQGYLDRQSMLNFPLIQLEKIDDFWVKFSNKRFGLSVQKRIWQSVGGKPGIYDSEIFNKFTVRVGWLKVKQKFISNEDWKIELYSDIKFDENAPEGHLPVFPWGGIGIHIFSNIES